MEAYLQSPSEMGDTTLRDGKSDSPWPTPYCTITRLGREFQEANNRWMLLTNQGQLRSEPLRCDSNAETSSPETSSLETWSPEKLRREVELATATSFDRRLNRSICCLNPIGKPCMTPS